MGKTARQSLTQRTLVFVAMFTVMVASILLVFTEVQVAEAAAPAQSSTAIQAAEMPSLKQEALSTQVTLAAQSYSATAPAPSNSASMYEVYPTYLFINAGPNACAYHDLYLAYRPKGGQWKVYGPMYSYNDYTVKGLKPKTTYEAALCYFNIYTDELGGMSNSITFKTAPNKKPAVKSVKVKAIKLKKHWQKIYGYVIYLGKRAYYTYKIRTTVTLKKKPKAKYITINGKTFKAKKKRYTVTTKKLVRYYNSPRGKKYTVSVYTFQNKTWKGYSKLYQKKRKIK